MEGGNSKESTPDSPPKNKKNAKDKEMKKRDRGGSLLKEGWFSFVSSQLVGRVSTMNEYILKQGFS
jgi:hypothetical protein